MAILKHLPSKNANYGQVVDYLMFKFDEHTNKPILDEKGNLQMRDTFYIEGINCSPYTFRSHCFFTNRKYNKNKTRAEIKTHQYIISFDPRDQIDRGLTEEKAQAIGMEFAKKFFPGYETLVCTHMDGNNKSGNINVHIVINSIRISDVEHDAERQPWITKKSEWASGYKHVCSSKFYYYAKKGLMDICTREKLHQVDLLKHAKKRVTDREYRAQQRGQKELDEANAKLIAEGKTITQTKYQTEKEFLREAIDNASHSAYSIDQFKNILATYGIQVIERHNGKTFSYKHPNRTRNISERSLGTDYGQSNITEVIKNNILRSQVEAQQQVENINSAVEKQIQDIQRQKQEELAEKYSIFANTTDEPTIEPTVIESEEPASNQPLPDIFDTSEPSIFDSDNNKQVNTNPQPERQVNVGQKQPSRKQLLDANYSEIQSVQKRIDNIDIETANKENTLNCLDQCNENRATYKEFISLKSNREKGKFRTNHQSAITTYENARNWLNKTYGQGKGKWPKRRQVQQEIDQLTESKSATEARLSSLQKERQEIIGSRPTPTKVKDRIIEKQGQNRNTNRGDNHARDKPSH